MSKIPSDLKYTPSHEWVKIEDGIATIGITDHAQSELGDVVFVDLPETGRKLSQEETFGSVESVKTVSDLYAPIAGEVIEINESLKSNSEILNSDPYGAGYLLKVRLADPAQVEKLLDAADYEAVIS